MDGRIKLCNFQTKEILSESSEWKIVYDKIYKEQECQNNLQDYLNF